MVVGSDADRFKGRVMKIHNLTVEVTSYISSFVGSPFDSTYFDKFNKWMIRLTNELGYTPTKKEKEGILRLTTQLDPTNDAVGSHQS